MSGPMLVVDAAVLLISTAILSALLPARAAKPLLCTALAAVILVVLAGSPQGDLVYRGITLLHAEGYLNSMAILLLTAELLILLETSGIDEYTGPLILAVNAAGILILYSGSPVALIAGIEAGAVAFTALSLYSGGRSIEAGLKYFYSSIIASSFLALGFSVLGERALYSFAEIQGSEVSPLARVIGLAMILSGLGIESGLMPFHFWVPDVAEAVPGSFLAVMMLSVDAPLLLVLFKLVAGAGAILKGGLAAMLALLSVLSMLVGEFSALVQENPRRMLGYSMVSDAGYTALLAVSYVLAGVEDLRVPVLFITASNVSLALIFSAYTGDRMDEASRVAVLAGLLSLAGVPPFYGFASKYSVLSALGSASHWYLAGIAAFFFLVCAAYIFRFILRWRPGTGGRPRYFFAAYAVLLLVLGLYPEIVFRIGGVKP